MTFIRAGQRDGVLVFENTPENFLTFARNRERFGTTLPKVFKRFQTFQLLCQPFIQVLEVFENVPERFQTTPSVSKHF